MSEPTLRDRTLAAAVALDAIRRAAADLRDGITQARDAGLTVVVAYVDHVGESGDDGIHPVPPGHHLDAAPWVHVAGHDPAGQRGRFRAPLDPRDPHADA